MKAIIKRIISPLLQKASASYLKKPRKYSYRGISVWVEPGVFPPFLTISTKLLLQFLETFDFKGKTFLELGCGCGIISIMAAKQGASVTAVDINETALEALRTNAVDNSVSLEILYSDMFGSLGDSHFDYIFINPPYYPKNPQSMAENAWFCGENFEYFEKLFKQLPDFLAANNETFLILSEDCAIDKIKAIALDSAMAFELVQEKKVMAETNYIFRIVKL